jgi:hypothetical protein
MRPRWFRRLTFLALIAAAAVGARHWLLRPRIVPVTVYRVARGTVESTVTTSGAGTVVSRQRATLSPEIGDRVDVLAARKGDRVRRGQVLLQINAADYRAERTLRERSLEVARATHTEACRGVELATREVERPAQLVREGISSRQGLDQLETARDSIGPRAMGGWPPPAGRPPAEPPDRPGPPAVSREHGDTGVGCRLIAMSQPTLGHLALVALLAAGTAGCSLKTMAINTVGNALAESGSTFAADDDPELVAAAVPFGLKTIEGLLAQAPKHKGLLFAACSGFTQYAYAFVMQPADYVEARDLDRAIELRARAKKLFLRARDYGVRSFEVEFPGFRDALKANPDATLARLSRRHVPLAYYTGAAWAAAFSIDVADAELATDQGTIEKLMRRALALDESWEHGSLHDFFISWEAAHASGGGSLEAARTHYERSRALAAGKRVSPLVSYAESVLVPRQDRAAFEALLNEALRFDPSKAPREQTLPNVLALRRATWLLQRADELF